MWSLCFTQTCGVNAVTVLLSLKQKPDKPNIINYEIPVNIKANFWGKWLGYKIFNNGIFKYKNKICFISVWTLRLINK